MKDLEWYGKHRGGKIGGLTEAQMNALLDAKVASAWTLDRIRRVVRAAKEQGVVLASHDDDSPERVEVFAREGVRISEFPVDSKSARKAKDLGLTVCVGAPNVVRGRSSGGNLSATEAVKQGLVDALVSDYHPPSMLQAAFKLAGKRVLSLPAAVGLTAWGPARAVGLTDRGEVREGALADLVVVGELVGLPTVTHVIVGGQVVLTAGDRVSTLVTAEP